MSLKAYDAFTLRTRRDPWDELMGLRHRLVEVAKDTILVICAEVVADKRAKLKEGTDPYSGYGVLAGDRYVYEQFKAADAQPHRDAYALDANITVRRFEGRYILRLHANGLMYEPMIKALKGEKILRDFHYQNQSEGKPKTVSTREWRERQRVWEAISEGDQEWDWLLMEVCTLASWSRLSPVVNLMGSGREDLMRKWRKAIWSSITRSRP